MSNLKTCAHCKSDKIRIIPTQEMRDRGFPKLVVCDNCNATSPNEEAWNTRPELIEDIIGEVDGLKIPEVLKDRRYLNGRKGWHNAALNKVIELLKSKL